MAKGSPHPLVVSVSNKMHFRYIFIIGWLLNYSRAEYEQSKLMISNFLLSNVK